MNYRCIHPFFKELSLLFIRTYGTDLEIFVFGAMPLLDPPSHTSYFMMPCIFFFTDKLSLIGCFFSFFSVQQHEQCVKDISCNVKACGTLWMSWIKFVFWPNPAALQIFYFLKKTIFSKLPLDINIDSSRKHSITHFLNLTFTPSHFQLRKIKEEYIHT